MSTATMPAFPRLFSSENTKNPAMERMEKTIEQLEKRNRTLETEMEQIKLEIRSESNLPVPARREVPLPDSKNRSRPTMMPLSEIFD